MIASYLIIAKPKGHSSNFTCNQRTKTNESLILTINLYLNKFFIAGINDYEIATIIYLLSIILQENL